MLVERIEVVHKEVADLRSKANVLAHKAKSSESKLAKLEAQVEDSEMELTELNSEHHAVLQELSAK